MLPWPTHLVLRILLPIALLVGCAQLPEAARQDRQVSRPARAAIDSFALSGRIAVHQAQQQYAANISWQHAPDHDEILLSTPMGQGIAELSRDRSGTRLTTAERREFTAPDWQALSTRMFGFALPLSRLPGWLLAHVPADALAASYDAAGRARSMVDADWQVAYLGYEDESGDALPNLIELQHGDIEVRLKIDAWDLLSADQR